MTVLYPYQLDGIKALAASTRHLLADDPGLGKTVQAIRAADAAGCKSILVICPKSAAINWAREWSRWSAADRQVRVISNAGQPALMGGVTVLPYSRVAAFFARDVDAWDVMIVDEAHFLKSGDAKRTVAVYGSGCKGRDGLVAKAARVWALTGTPVPNHPGELWPMLRALSPERIMREERPRSYTAFVSRYCKIRQTPFGDKIVGGRNLTELRQALRGFMTRRRKDDVLMDLPPLRVEQVLIEGDTRGVQPKDKAVVLAAVEAGVAFGPALKGTADHIATLRRVSGLAKVPAVADLLEDELAADPGRKFVVFCHHREVIDNLSTALDRIKAGYVVLDGRTADRQGVVDRFQRDAGCRVFIGQIQAAGTAITLTAAQDVLMLEASWVPAENKQAADRCHRIGQAGSVLVRYVTLAGCIDEDIQAALVRKAATISALMD